MPYALSFHPTRTFFEFAFIAPPADGSFGFADGVCDFLKRHHGVALHILKFAPHFVGYFDWLGRNWITRLDFGFPPRRASRASIGCTTVLRENGFRLPQLSCGLIAADREDRTGNRECQTSRSEIAQPRTSKCASHSRHRVYERRPVSGNCSRIAGMW
jgi:hypothetical protein